MLDVLLKVNGKKIPLNIFVKNLIVNVILGIVKSLKGVKNPKNFELKIKL